MRTFFKLLALLVLIGAAIVLAVLIPILRRGVSARDEPTWIETVVARQVRHLAIPRSARDRRNPTPATPEVVAEARAHFADHCASCHANDGSGRTDLGRGLYPKPPDMRLPPTQHLSDGELFAIIEQGVRLTGMPAWSTGTPEGAEQSWQLVHFIRHLPSITAQEIEEMEALNPRSPAEIKTEQEIDRFLEGDDTSAQRSKKSPRKGHHD
jgi:mono/diheme cytochrome c family protein